MPLIVVCNVFQERMAFWGICQLLSFVMCFKNVWYFPQKELWSSWVPAWGASGILREMPFIVVTHVFKERKAFCWEMPFIVVCNVFQERLAFYGKCLWSSWVHVWGASNILWEMTFIFVCNVFQESLAFYGKCLWSSCIICSRASGILLQLPSIVLS